LVATGGVANASSTERKTDSCLLVSIFWVLEAGLA